MAAAKDRGPSGVRDSVPRKADLINEYARTSDHPAVVSARDQLNVVVMLAHGEEIAARIKARERAIEREREITTRLFEQYSQNVGIAPVPNSRHKVSFIRWLLGKT